MKTLNIVFKFGDQKQKRYTNIRDDTEKIYKNDSRKP